MIAAPLAVGLATGIDRKITAHIQNRIGPPVVQPFYDILKLLFKRPLLINNLQVVFAGTSLLFHAVALTLFVLGGDLLLAFFVTGTGTVFMTMGAFVARSPFSYIGGQRQFLLVLACEPVIFMAIVSIGLHSSFLVRNITGGLLTSLPLVLIALVPVLVILLEKSPYDIPTAHQEVITGPYIEYSGPYLAILKLARWFELAFIFGIFTLFIWSDNVVVAAVGKVAIAFVALFVAILIDNITARLTRGRMVRFTLLLGIGLVAVNLLALYVANNGVL